MNYYSRLNECNLIKGNIIDTSFPGIQNAFKYIELVNSSFLLARQYYIVQEFSSEPWQPAFDFSNEIKNKIKKKSRLIKDRLNENYLKTLGPVAVAIIDLNTISEDMFKVVYSYVKVGGILIVKPTNNLNKSLNLIDKLCNKKYILHLENFSIVNKTKTSQLGKIKRSKSTLT